MPMQRGVPDRTGGLGSGLGTGDADVIQGAVVQPGQGAALFGHTQPLPQPVANTGSGQSTRFCQCNLGHKFCPFMVV